MPKTLQSNYRVMLTPADSTAPRINAPWATSEGGALTREIGPVWNGGGTYDLLPAKTTAEDITLTKPYDPQEDDGWLNQLRRNMNAGEVCSYNMSKHALGARGASVGKVEVHARCPVRTVRTTPVTAGAGADSATVEIVLATKGPAN